MKALIRGIYSTALTKLLLDNGFDIVQPSLTIKKRFGLPDSSAAPDIKIKDRYDLQGIRVAGTLDSVNALQHILHSTFEDTLTRKWTVSVDGIYKAKLVETSESSVYVDLGDGIVGWLSKYELHRNEDEPLIVQVKRRRIGAKEPILTTNLKIVGEYAILAQDSDVGVSLRIHDLDKRAELYNLGKALALEKWGIIWRESAANQQKEMLEKEIVELTEKVKSLKEKVIHADAPSLLIEGIYVMDVEFPWFSKRSLDGLRATITPTLDGHHFYKSCGGNVSSALEMAEKLLENGNSQQQVAESFRDQVSSEFPEEGSRVDVEHVKLSGIVFHLGESTIETADNEQIRYSRIMQRDGFYDGLNVKKEAGDKAVSETKVGEWHITTKYFSNNGEWKGTYINLNTPVEVYPKTIRYVDLEADICLSPDGTVKVLDMEKLEKATEKGFISKKLCDSVKETTKQLKKDKIRWFDA
jgi:protein associated with RNAse G/E